MLFSPLRRALWYSCVELFRMEVQVEVARVPEDQRIFLAKGSDFLPRRPFVRLDPTEEGLEGSQLLREGELAVPAGVDIVLLEVAKPVCVLDRLVIGVFLFHEDDGVADGMRCQGGYADVPVGVIGAFEELLSGLIGARAEDTLVQSAISSLEPVYSTPRLVTGLSPWV